MKLSNLCRKSERGKKKKSGTAFECVELSSPVALKMQKADCSYLKFQAWLFGYCLDYRVMSKEICTDPIAHILLQTGLGFVPLAQQSRNQFFITVVRNMSAIWQNFTLLKELFIPRFI